MDNQGSSDHTPRRRHPSSLPTSSVVPLPHLDTASQRRTPRPHLIPTTHTHTHLHTPFTPRDQRISPSFLSFAWCRLDPLLPCLPCSYTTTTSTYLRYLPCFARARHVIHPHVVLCGPSKCLPPLCGPPLTQCDAPTPSTMTRTEYLARRGVRHDAKISPSLAVLALQAQLASPGPCTCNSNVHGFSHGPQDEGPTV